ncbi:alkylation response protein AidB-like acyl-CoA dehydrogenase [Actinocorallia herbida]|uniref:Alkylation response protein AidB-like acyl-CoA dehydrogenase n=1 Tax=Actinocorallia herbida TaxID=58109 RepID=A0A3N1D302_9ACTN|nr:acyl-CoA dehydrogenase family protein [Actinocorallia herbida]ROO87917.1 alkylation response protein AidB-like acyl-CoA dehydrogenase [Actinocorallia herbida]
MSGLEDELRDTVSALLRKRCTPEAVAALADGPEPYDRALWAELAEMGLPGLAVPEALGGAGLGLSAAVVVQEELGRSIAPAPTVSLAAVTAAAITAGSRGEAWIERLVSGETVAAVAAGRTPSGWTACDEVKAEREGDAWRLHGRVPVVAEALAADVLLVAVEGGDGLLLFLAAPAEVTPVDSLDPTRPLGTAVFDGPAELIAEGAGARTVLDAAERTALLLLAADAVGVAAAATDLAVDYAKTRHQFGRAIGSFQAVAHRCADMFVAVESARALVAAAASACDEDAPDAATAVALAAANALDAAVTATQGSVQVHGGMGFTWEHVSHRHLRRAKAAEALIAFPDRLRDRATTTLLNSK